MGGAQAHPGRDQPYRELLEAYLRHQISHGAGCLPKLLASTREEAQALRDIGQDLRATYIRQVAAQESLQGAGCGHSQPNTEGGQACQDTHAGSPGPDHQSHHEGRKTRRCWPPQCQSHTRQDKAAILGGISPIYRSFFTSFPPMLWYPIRRFSTHMFTEFAHFRLFSA